MAVEPIIVVLGPFGGGTSAVAAVLHHLGVFMGAGFDLTYREPYETWEDSNLGALCRNAFTTPGGQLQMDAGAVQAKLCSWAGEHRRAARAAGRRPGVKQPILCAAVDLICAAWGPVLPVVVERPYEKTVASLNRLGWWADERERAEATAHLIALRDQALAGVRAVRVDFEALRVTPAVVIRHLAAELGLQVTPVQVEAAVCSIVQPADVGARNTDPRQNIRDRLLAEVERNPKDGWAVFLLAATYFDAGDFADARRWYARRVEMGGSDEEIYYALYQVAESMMQLGEPWPDVQDAYLKAWELRPIRAEPLFAIARRHRAEGRYRLGYLFARLATETPVPEDDSLFDASVYAWRAADEQAICGFYVGEQAETFGLCRRLLARADVPEPDRQRIAGNRDFSVPVMLAAASSYPEALVDGLRAGAPDAEVTVSLIAGPDRSVVEATLNSFVSCCSDVSLVGRFVLSDVGLSAADRAVLGERYAFVEFVDGGGGLAQLRNQIRTRLWLHLGAGWRFFAPENLTTRLTAVLEAEPQVFAVGVNFADAATLIGACAAEAMVRRAPGAGRYVLTDAVAAGPVMFETARLDRAGGVNDTDPEPIGALGCRAAAAGLHTASLDEVLCITTPA